MDQLQPIKQPGYPNDRKDYEETTGYVLDSVHVWEDYLAILMRRRWAIITVFLAVMVTVTIYSFATTPQYKATTQILIEREGPRIRELGELAPRDNNSDEFYETQYKLLGSRALAKKVMKNLKLQEHPYFQPLFKALPPDPEPVEVQQAEEALVSKLLSKVEVTPIKNTRLVEVSVTDPDPRFAAQVANALAKGYSEQSLDIRFGAARETAIWLQEQLQGARKKLEESEARLNEYKKENNIIINQDKESITAQKLEQLNRELTIAQTKRLEAESRYKQVVQGRPPTEVLASPVIQNLKSQEAKILAEQSELHRKFGYKHPRMQQINEELAAIRQSIGAETARINQSIKDQYQIAREQEKNLIAALNEAKSETQVLGDKAIEYQMLLRDVQTNRAIHDNMLKSLKETTATQNIPSTHIRITNQATPPSIPTYPKKKRNILLAAVLGLVMGVGTALLFENLDNTLKTPKEVEGWLRVPNLALIPHLKRTGQVNDQKAPDLIMHHESRSMGSEAYRTLRTSITLSTPGHSPHTILVTSSQPMEGKTFTASNLATAMANTGDKVLLVDADLRRPTLHKVLTIDQEPGLSNFLVGKIDHIPAVETLVPHLFGVPSGPIPPNPAELLGSERMREFLRQARDQFDRVIVDSPPIMSVTDAAILATMVEGVLQVVKAETVTRRTSKEALKSILEVQGRVLGTVLNDVPSGFVGYYYNYYHYRHQSYYLPDDADHHSGKPTSLGKEKESTPWAWIKDRLNFPNRKMGRNSGIQQHAAGVMESVSRPFSQCWEGSKGAAGRITEGIQSLTEHKDFSMVRRWIIGITAGVLALILIIWVLQKTATPSAPLTSVSTPSAPETLKESEAKPPQAGVPPLRAGSQPAHVHTQTAQVAPKPAATPASKDHYQLMVATYSDYGDALFIKKKILAKKIPAKVYRRTANKKVYFDVKAGPFTSKKQADGVASNLKSSLHLSQTPKLFKIKNDSVSTETSNSML